MNIEELYALAKDRQLQTPEHHQPNDFYGHANVLKRFIGMPVQESTNCVIVHGPMFPSLHWDGDLNAPLPVLLTANKTACSALRTKTDKIIFSIGPMLAYAPCHIDQDTLALEKKRLGKNLLVFPTHSTHHIEARYDAEWMCKEIAEIGKNYDSVTVCLYWKDILNGIDTPFRAAGFHCSTAGHIYDPYFLDRLKTLFTLSDGVVTYSWTSALGYAVFMDKPVIARHARGEQFIAPEHIIERDTLGGRHVAENNLYKSTIFNLFKEFQDTSDKQREAINYMWGIDEVKSRENITKILNISNDISLIRETLQLSFFPSIIQMSKIYRHMNIERACVISEQAITMKNETTEFLLNAAWSQIYAGNKQRALKYVKKIIHSNQKNKKELKAILNACE